MPIDFPSTPATNDTYTYNGKTWKFNGTAWDFTVSTYGSEFKNANFIAMTETVNVVASAATGTINVDALTSSAWYYTSNATANFTLNFRADSSSALSTIVAVGESITLTFMNTNGTTPYYANVIQVDGVTVTPKWQNAVTPIAGNASSIDVYTFAIIKTAATPTYTVLGSQVRFA